MKIKQSGIDKFMYAINEDIMLSVKTKRIVLLGIDEQTGYKLLKEAWKKHQEFRKYAFPLRGHRDTTDRVYFERINDWEMI